MLYHPELNRIGSEFHQFILLNNSVDYRAPHRSSFLNMVATEAGRTKCSCPVHGLTYGQHISYKTSVEEKTFIWPKRGRESIRE